MNLWDHDDKSVEESNCYICEQVFGRQREATHYCRQCGRGYCQGEHGISSGEEGGLCIACSEISGPIPGIHTVNPRYTFDNFVVYPGNSFAHAACLEVAKNPGKRYNPLFIHGGVGLGKTHLLDAIGNYLLTHGTIASSRICCITAERFTSGLINAIRYETLDSFRRTFRSVDIFMMSAIQFLAGKERITAELLHTFETLYDGKKQMVFECDIAPGDITYLPESLRSRFESGLVADIAEPDFTARVEIVRQKAAIEEIDLPDDVTEFIAHNCQGSIRALEGAVIKLAAYSRLCNVPITLDSATKLREGQ